MKIHGLPAALSCMVLLCACGTLESGPDRMVSEADHALAGEIHRRLQAANLPQAGLVGVLAEDGVVTLYGSVEEQAVRAQVESIAAGTPGVTRVESRMDR